ncbi:MAG: class I SAM-dependent methyltransferase [Pseudonocardiaceae bacterium]
MTSNIISEAQQPASMAGLQQSVHGEGHDYAAGSPHIRHHALRSAIVATLQEVVGEVLDARGSCRVLEVGAGHGVFTDHLVAMGAQVTVTEMSAPSARVLRDRFRHNDRVQVVLDQDGGCARRVGPVDVVACLSVLHHIPDYLSAVGSYVERIAPGGAFVSFQDPLWHERRSRRSRLVEHAAYLMWRLPQGEFRRGLASVGRRLRGELDETKASDMVEYHVVRAGVDEVALRELLRPHFAVVRLVTYWSTQADLAQALGSRFGPPTNFGLIARKRR